MIERLHFIFCVLETFMNKSVDVWLAQYGESHTNPINKLIHWVAVPVIYITVFGLLWDIPRPSIFTFEWINWATIMVLPVLAFYFLLSLTIGVAMTLFSAAMVAMLYCLNQWLGQQQWLSLATLSLIVFVVMWVFQFIGHHIEGKKPSFFKDLQFLLIGPAWVFEKITK